MERILRGEKPSSKGMAAQAFDREKLEKHIIVCRKMAMIWSNNSEPPCKTKEIFRRMGDSQMLLSWKRNAHRRRLANREEKGLKKRRRSSRDTRKTRRRGKAAFFFKR